MRSICGLKHEHVRFDMIGLNLLFFQLILILECSSFNMVYFDDITIALNFVMAFVTQVIRLDPFSTTWNGLVMAAVSARAP